MGELRRGSLPAPFWYDSPMRRHAPLLTFALSVVVLGAAFVLSRRADPPTRAPAPPRRPAHPAALDRSEPAVKRGLEEMDRLRRLRVQRQIPMGGAGDVEYEETLARLRQAAPRLLHYLEETALLRGENVSLRVDLLNLVAQHPGEETRRFLSTLVLEPLEDPSVRLAALEPLMRYRDAATFEVLRAAWDDPTPFAGRYHLCRAFGENGQPGAIPILRQALAADRPLDVRAHAALGLGGFVEDDAVRAELKRLALADPVPVVRQNAIRSLRRSTAGEVDSFLRDLAASPTADAETRRVAQAILAERGRNP